MSAQWMAKRTTADGRGIYLWPDGALTWAFGVYAKGSAHPRTAEQRANAVQAGWLVMGEIEIYDEDEVPALIGAARWCVDHGRTLPGDVRGRLHRRPVVRPHWAVLESDRDGTPRVRCWRLPRLRWPGLAVWHEAGRYSVCERVTSAPGPGTYGAALAVFSNLRDLSAYLESIPLPGSYS